MASKWDMDEKHKAQRFAIRLIAATETQTNLDEKRLEVLNSALRAFLDNEPFRVVTN